MIAVSLHVAFGCVALALLLRIIALDTMVINAIALIVLIGMIGGNDTYFEAALLLAMVGFVSTIAYCKFILRGDIVE